MTITFNSCYDISKSCCEDVLNFSYIENDSIITNSLDIAQKCHKKYHKRPEFLQKLSQIYYYEAINNYTSEEEPSANNILQSTKKLYLALDNINSYFDKIDEIKQYEYSYRGEIYERLADIYKDINSLKPASELYNKALSDYEVSNNDEKYLNTLIKIGKLYQYNHIHNIAMIYFEMAEEKVKNHNNIYRKIIDNKIVTLYELNDYKKADSIFTNHFNVKIQDYDFHSALGTKHFYHREYEQAIPHLKYCFENGSQQEKIVLSEKLAEAYFNLNDHSNEMLYIQHQAKNNSIEIRKTPLKLDLDKLFDTNHNNNEKQSQSGNRKNSNSIYVILPLISIICIFIIIFRNKRLYIKKTNTVKKIINENDTNKKEITPLNNEIYNSAKQIIDTNKSESFEDAYKRFCESSICTKIKSSFEGITIMTKNVQDYSKMALSNKDIILVTKTFNSCFPKAVSSIKHDFELITPGDIKFLILDFMNLNNVEIAVLLGLTYGATNKKCNKIKNIFKTKDDLSTFMYNYIKSNF